MPARHAGPECCPTGRPDGAASAGRGGLAGLRLDGIDVTDATLTWGDRGSGRGLALRGPAPDHAGPLDPGQSPWGLHLSGRARAGWAARRHPDLGDRPPLPPWDGWASGRVGYPGSGFRVAPDDLVRRALGADRHRLGVPQGRARLAIRFDLAPTGLDLWPRLHGPPAARPGRRPAALAAAGVRLAPSARCRRPIPRPGPSVRRSPPSVPPNLAALCLARSPGPRMDT